MGFLLCYILHRALQLVHEYIYISSSLHTIMPVPWNYFSLHVGRVTGEALVCVPFPSLLMILQLNFI